MIDSRIEWTHDTVNPWWGCSMVSPGCEHCYAQALGHRFGVAWGMKADRRLRVDAALRDLRKSAKVAERTGERRRVFIASMADVWDQHPDLVEPREQFLSALRAMGADCGLTPILLTKRAREQAAWAREHDWPTWWVPMVTVEDQRRAEERIPQLLSIDAPVRGLSCEPLLGDVNLNPWLVNVIEQQRGTETQSIDLDGDVVPADEARVNLGCTAPARRKPLGWVIAGGESGRGARPMHADWARSLRDQCAAAGVPFFFKQWGAWAPADRGTGARLVGKRAAGRNLDGKTWDDVPPATLLGGGMSDLAR